MENISTAFTVVLIILLRFGLPILLTILLVYFLRRMDARWQKQAEEELAHAPKMIPATPCWEVQGCSAKQKQSCPAFINPEIPCWQQFRSADGQLDEDCLECGVFVNAPVTVTA